METEYGYHIIKVEEVLLGKTLTLKEAKDRITLILTAQKQQQGYDDWMEELKKTAFIEVNLFEEPDKNKSLVSRGSDKKKTNGEGKAKKALSAGSDSQQSALQQKWEKMYKSVEKPAQPKGDSGKYENSELESLEKKLRDIKKLRDQNRISEQEYQKRKENLLNRL